MNRRTFLQSLGLGAIALALKPLRGRPGNFAVLPPVKYPKERKPGEWTDTWKPTAWVPPANRSSAPKIAENLHCGEARQILRALDWDGKSDLLVYLNPPFDNGANWPKRTAVWEGQRLHIESAPAS